MNLKQQLDELVLKYETKDFIKDDPIQFPHRFKEIKDIELAGFIASVFAFGNRKVFIRKLNELFALFQNEPKNFIENFERKSLKGFNYRFAKEEDVEEIFLVLKKLYSSNSSLEELFRYGYETKDFHQMLKVVTDYFYSNMENTFGAKYLIPDANKNGAMKRVNMLLRWLVRDGVVDLGVWKFIDKSELLIPLDTHVARISREMNLLKRNSNDFKAVKELTNELKIFDKNDPVKYDFAMFGYGIDNPKSKVTNVNKII